MSGVGRFRVNIHRQRGSLGIASRRILPNAPDFVDLDKVGQDATSFRFALRAAMRQDPDVIFGC